MTQVELNIMKTMSFFEIFLTFISFIFMIFLIKRNRRADEIYHRVLLPTSILVFVLSAMVALTTGHRNSLTEIGASVILPITILLIVTYIKSVKSKSHILQRNDLVKQLFRKKSDENAIANLSLLLAFSGEYVLFVQTRENTLWWVMILTVVLLLVSLVNQRILKYRVDHGLYGTCYSEAKEIVAFILEWHRKNGNSNGKPPKLVFTQEEIDECLQANGGEEYAG